MYLDREQEAMLGGERGPSLQWAMEVLLKEGERCGAEELVSATSVHIPDWCSDGSETAWKFLSSITRPSPIPITANPSTRDPIDRGRKEALEGLRPPGCHSFSCTPQLMGNHPGKGDHIAWGGRAASAFANSIFDARSEMESFGTTVASAIARLTPLRGLHLDENRRPTIAVELPQNKVLDYAMIGWELSRSLKAEVPLLCGARPNFDQAKRLALAINSLGTVPMFRIQREPSAPVGLDSIEVSGDVKDDRSHPTPDLVILGCPHLSEQDINRWAKRLAGHDRSTREVWFFTSHLCMDKCPIFGAVLRSHGSMFIDTCPLGMIERISGRWVACDSPSLAECLRGRGARAFYVNDEELFSYMVR